MAPRRPKRACVAWLIAACGLAACNAPPAGVFQGYAEGEFVRVAAPFAGSLERLSVKRGSEVQPGTPLFALEQANEAAGRREAEERVRNAEATLENLRKSKRPPEVDTVKAQQAQAQAALKMAEVTLKRQQELVAQNFVSKETLDQAYSNYEQSKARVAELAAQLTTAQISTGRSDEIRAAEFNAKAAREALAQADWRLAQKTVGSPVAGSVVDTLYVQGEWVPAGMPVVSLLPPQNIKLRFFVPEAVLGAIRIGQQVGVSCDGCKQAVPATVTFVSPQAEYTPPVIYSRESRAKLVYLIEARPAPADAVLLHPGQPVEIHLQ